MTMKALILAVALAAGFTTPAVGASFADLGFRLDVQAQKGRPGQERGQPPGRDYRPDRRGGDNERERRERMNDDERRALHRDLDKANRELYKQRPR